MRRRDKNTSLTTRSWAATRTNARCEAPRVRGVTHEQYVRYAPHPTLRADLSRKVGKVH
jgi:hypothetical protein